MVTTMTHVHAALAAMTIETPKEIEALKIAKAFVAQTGHEGLGYRWMPYDKLGDHSRISFVLLMPRQDDPQAIVNTIEAICDRLVETEGLKGAHVSSFFQDDGSLFYERLFDARTSPFRFPGINWFDIEINTNLDAQQNLLRLIGRGED
jgi:hypothetical protein